MLGRQYSSFHTTIGQEDDNEDQQQSFMSAAAIVPEGYEAILDEASNCYYYWNKATGETSWEVPQLDTQDDQPSYFGSTHGGKSLKSTFPSSMMESIEESSPRDNVEVRGLDTDERFRQQHSFNSLRYSTSFNMDEMIIKDPTDDDAWNTKGKVLNTWQGHLSSDDDELHPIEAGRATVQYAPNVLGNATKINMETEDITMARHSSDEETSIGKQDPMNEDFERQMRCEPDVVNEILETEEERTTRKFKNMRKNGAIMVSELNGWEQWRSPHGAVFYSRVGDQGGQWKAPFEFPDVYSDTVLEKKVGGTLENLKIEYANAIQKRNNSPVSNTATKTPIRSVSMQLPETLTKDYALSASGKNPNDLNRINLLDRAFVNKPLGNPGDEDDDFYHGDDTMNFDESGGDDLTGKKKPKAVDAATKRLKDIYKSLRFRDKALDNAIELNEVKRKADEAKKTWEKYLDTKAEEDFNKQHYGGKKRYDPQNPFIAKVDNDSDEEDVPVTDFNTLYARSIIVQQRWPWTALIDVQTDRTFYRHEVEDFFQAEPPAEMIKYEAEILQSKTSILSSSRELKDTDDNSMISTSNRYEQVSGGMSERYKLELVKRKEHEKVLRGKMKELFKSDSESEAPPTLPDELKAQKDGKSGVDGTEAKKAEHASAIIERISKQIEAQEKSKKPPAKALYAPPKHVGGRRTSMFNVNITKFVRKYNPSGIQNTIDEHEEDLEVLQTLKKNGGSMTGGSRLAQDVSADRSKRISEPSSETEADSFLPPPNKKRQFVDIAWLDAQTLLKRLRWFSVQYDQQQLKSSSKSASTSSSLLKEGASVRSKWSKIRNQLNSDIGALSLSGVDLGKDLNEDMSKFALLRAKRVGKHASLQELKAAAAIRRKICHESKVYTDKVKSSLEVINSYIYEDDETIMTMIESEIYRRHALEAAVFMKCSLVRPISIKDLKAYTGVPNYVLCPQAAVSFDLSLPKMISHSLPSGFWEVLEDPSGKTFFCEKKTGQMQGGEPFDIEFKRLTKSLKYERWYDYGRKHILQEQDGKALPPEIMSDEQGGLLFFCPHKKLYNWREQINIGYYDLAPEVSTKKSPAAEALSSQRSAGANKNPVAMKIADTGERINRSKDEQNTEMSKAAKPSDSIPTINGKSSTAPALPGGKRAPRHSLMSRAHLENRSGSLWTSMNSKPAANPASIPVLPSSLKKDNDSSPGSLNHVLGKITEGMPDINEEEEEEDDEDEDEDVSTQNGKLLLPSEIIKMASKQDTSKQENNTAILSKSLDSGGVESYVNTAINSGRKSIVKKRLSISSSAAQVAYVIGETELDDGENDSQYSDTIKARSRANPMKSSRGNNDISSGPLSTASKNPFEGLITNKKNGNSINASSYLNGPSQTSVTASLDNMDMETLEFEEELTSADYDEYCDLISKVKQNPNDIRLILDLAEFFLAIYLHKEGLACLTRVLDLSMLKPLPVTEFATVTLIIARLSARYLGEFRLLSILKDTVNSCPEHPPVLCLAAKLYEILRADEAAEQLYIGAMLLDPDYSPALEGYASLLIRQGNLSTAARYLNRIEEKYTGYPVSRLKLGWVNELLGADPDVVLLTYQSVLGLNLRNRPTVLTYAALGHFYHVRGDLQRAVDYYSRGLKYDRNDVNCLILHASALGSSILPGSYRKDSSRSSIATADSHFRRGLFFNQKGSNRWIGLLAYADFLMSCKYDAYTAEDVLWDACRISCQHAVWPSIALIQHYQYIRGNIVKARRVILWVTNRRKKVTSQTLIRRANLMAAKADAGPLLFGESPAEPDLPEDIVRDIEETVALMITEAYCLYDAQDYTTASRKVADILSTDKKHASALRLQALLDWQRHARVDSMLKFDSAYRYGSNNVFFLRSYSIACALMGEYSKAIQMMITAVDICPLNPLCWRALGLMSYLYENDREHCLGYFARAFELSDQKDLEAVRLKGQVLMELGRYEEAKQALETAMKLAPGDPILLCSLSMCLTALGYQPSSTAYHSTNYDLKFQLMDDLSELMSTKDPQELMEAAICTNLSTMVADRKKRKLASYSRNKVSALGKGWNMIKNLKDNKQSSMEDEKTTEQDAPPAVLYWYGLYCLHRGAETRDPDLNYKAKALFKRAIQRRDHPPHPLALHMLGWMAELEGDLRAAERYYCHALQLEPIEPEMYLQLANAIKKTHNFVKSIATTGKEKARKKSRPVSSSWKKKKKGVKKSFDQYNDDILIALDSAGGEDTDGPALAPPIVGGSDSLMQAHKRLLLHDRVVWLLDLRSQQMNKYIHGIFAPGKFVYIDPFWLDHLMTAFSECDDWATLLKTCPTFRNAAAKNQSDPKKR